MRILVGITGASGAIYAEKLIQELLKHFLASETSHRIYLIWTEAAEQVIQYELRPSGPLFSLRECTKSLKPRPEHREILRILNINDLFAPVASGSSAPDSMIVIPSSMGLIARVRSGISSTLLERAADVMIKENRQLIICPRESPFSTIHLENMLALNKMGVTILPPMPYFYNHPKSLDDIINGHIGRMLEHLKIPHRLYAPWNERRR